MLWGGLLRLCNFTVWVVRCLLGLGVALDARGLFPGVDLVGVGFVFVLDESVEAGDGGVGVVEAIYGRRSSYSQ